MEKQIPNWPLVYTLIRDFKGTGMTKKMAFEAIMFVAMMFLDLELEGTDEALARLNKAVDTIFAEGRKS